MGPTLCSYPKTYQITPLFIVVNRASTTQSTQLFMHWRDSGKNPIEMGHVFRFLYKYYTVNCEFPFSLKHSLTVESIN